MKRVLRALLASLLAVAVAVGGSVELALYACAMDGQVHTSCCCPEVDTEGPVASATDDGSCDVRTIQSDLLPAAEPRLASAAELQDIVADVPRPLGTRAARKPARRLLAPFGPRAPPGPTGTPIYIQVCSWLI